MQYGESQGGMEEPRQRHRQKLDQMELPVGWDDRAQKLVGVVGIG